MIKTRKIGIIFLFSILFIVTGLAFPGKLAKASMVTIPTYVFKVNNKAISDSSEYELKTSQMMAYVLTTDGIAPTSVQWKSSETGVVTLDPTANSNAVNMVRKGPGFSLITADVTQGGYTYSISFIVKVDLQVDKTKTGTVDSNINGNPVLVLNKPLDGSVIDKKRIYLKYAIPEDPTDTSGTEIISSAVAFESANPGVVTVDEDGWVTAVGAGCTKIKITSKTMNSKETPMDTYLTVAVTPDFKLTYTDSNEVVYTKVSKSKDTDASAIYNNIPSSFEITSNAQLGKNINWVVKNVIGDTKTEIPAGKSSKMTYTINDNGTVSFSNVKAGTYEIYGFADESFSEDGGIPYAYMKIFVPIDIGSQNIVMSVGDTYNVVNNSNIPSTKIFYNNPEQTDTEVALMDTSSYIITAKKKGTSKITLVYNTGQEIFPGLTGIGDMVLNVTVIDGIALNTTSANLYINGTLQLEAVVTNKSEVTWKSSNSSIVTVNEGLVTGLKAGTAFVTASQTINGVVKTATCKITVQPTVTSITIDPVSITLPIGGLTTLHAVVSPSNLTGVKLQWKSSNDSIVKIVEPNALTTTIQAVAGGHAVISAINQDNVVVGYCDVTVLKPATGITLSETAVTADLSMKYIQLRATVTDEYASNKTVIWSSTDSTKASVNQNGLVTLLKPGTVTIVATSQDNAAKVAYCNITIQIPIVSVALDEKVKTMYVGQSARLSYVVLPMNASNSAVTWTSTNTTVATVDAGGLVTARGVGTAVIILQTLDGGHSVYCNITVKQVATAIKFDVAQLALKSGEYYYLKVTLTPKNSTENDVVWESSDTKVAIVDDNGKVTAKNAGSAVIIARTEAGGIAYCKVSVTQPVSGLVLNFTEKTIYKGEKFDLIVSVSPSTASKLDVTWKSSNTKVATVNSKGEVAGLIGGVAIISCTTVDGGYTAACVVTVRETVTSVKLNYDSYKIGVKKTVMLTATVTTETATNLKVTWSSSNKKVAVVNQKGKVTGIAVGYATITATAADGSEVEASCEIRVVTPVSSMSISKATLSMYVGDSKKLSATVKPKNATYKTAKWSSSDDSIAIVDDGLVIGVKAGSVTITAEALDDSGKKAICYVTVHDRVASTGVTLQDKSITMVPGEKKMVNVVLIPAVSTDGKKWSTDNSAVASVDKYTGRITAKSTGTAYITVMTDSGKTATVEVTVIGLNMKKLVTEQYQTYDSALSVEGATSTVTWRSSNPLVAVVYSNGTVSTRGVGTATITATVNGRRLYCKVVVHKIP